jgi:hypothetical protein
MDKTAENLHRSSLRISRRIVLQMAPAFGPIQRYTIVTRATAAGCLTAVGTEVPPALALRWAPP